MQDGCLFSWSLASVYSPSADGEEMHRNGQRLSGRPVRSKAEGPYQMQWLYRIKPHTANHSCLSFYLSTYLNSLSDGNVTCGCIMSLSPSITSYRQWSVISGSIAQMECLTMNLPYLQDVTAFSILV